MMALLTVTHQCKKVVKQQQKMLSFNANLLIKNVI